MVVGGKLFKRTCRGPLSQEEASVGWILGEGSQIGHVFLKEWSMSTTFPWLLFIFLFQIVLYECIEIQLISVYYSCVLQPC